MLSQDSLLNGRFRIHFFGFFAALICLVFQELLCGFNNIPRIILFAFIYMYLAFLHLKQKRKVYFLVVLGVLHFLVFVNGFVDWIGGFSNLQVVLQKWFDALAYGFLAYLVCARFNKKLKTFPKMEFAPALCMSLNAIVTFIQILTQYSSTDNALLAARILLALEYIALSWGMYRLNFYFRESKSVSGDILERLNTKESPSKTLFNITSIWFLVAAILCTGQEITAYFLDTNRTPANLIYEIVILLLFAFLQPGKIWNKVFLWWQVFMRGVLFCGYIGEAIGGMLQQGKVYQIPYQGLHMSALLVLLLLSANWFAVTPKLRYLPTFFVAVGGGVFLLNLTHKSGTSLLTTPYSDALMFALWIAYHICYTVAIYQLSMKLFKVGFEKREAKELAVTETETIGEALARQDDEKTGDGSVS